jgi:ElaB/YqjD/DUF883 family membrane-anchored ribosome-binding protein
LLDWTTEKEIVMKNGDIARNLASNVADAASHFVDAGRKVVVETAGDAKDAVVDRGGKMVTMLSKSIRKRPLLAIGIAFGVGYIAMRITRR